MNYAKIYAKEYGLVAQGKGETDSAFRARVAEKLRAMGKIIEAHEVVQNARWDDESGQGEMARAGVVGAVAKVVQDVEYSGDEIGSDIAAGIVSTEGDNTALEAALNKFGPEAFTAMIAAMFGK